MSTCPISGKPCGYPKPFIVKQPNGNVQVCPNCEIGDSQNLGQIGFLPIFKIFGIKPPEINPCPRCGTTEQMMLSSGKLGCPECYNFFINPLKDAIYKLHGFTNHVGKKPKQIESVETLEEKLKIAIKEEKYEEAALLRDKIKNFKHK